MEKHSTTIAHLSTRPFLYTDKQTGQQELTYDPIPRALNWHIMRNAKTKYAREVFDSALVLPFVTGTGWQGSLTQLNQVHCYAAGKHRDRKSTKYGLCELERIGVADVVRSGNCVKTVRLRICDVPGFDEFPGGGVKIPPPGSQLPLLGGGKNDPERRGKNSPPLEKQGETKLKGYSSRDRRAPVERAARGLNGQKHGILYSKGGERQNKRCKPGGRRDPRAPKEVEMEKDTLRTWDDGLSDSQREKRAFAREQSIANYKTPLPQSKKRKRSNKKLGNNRQLSLDDKQVSKKREELKRQLAEIEQRHQEEAKQRRMAPCRDTPRSLAEMTLEDVEAEIQRQIIKRKTSNVAAKTSQGSADVRRRKEQRWPKESFKESNRDLPRTLKANSGGSKEKPTP